MSAGWYYYADKDYFGGIFFSEEYPEDREHVSPNGPFRTFGLAKRDALAYFRADVTIALENIRDVKACKKTKPSDATEGSGR